MAKEGRIGKGVLTRNGPGNYVYRTKYRQENGNIQINDYVITRLDGKWSVAYFSSRVYEIGDKFPTAEGFEGFSVGSFGTFDFDGKAPKNEFATLKAAAACIERNKKYFP